MPIFLFLLFVFTGATALAEPLPDENTPAEHIILGAENSWPPFSNADGSGISNQIVRSAFAAVGVVVDIRVYPYARVLHLVENGKLAGGFNVTRQHSTTPLFVFGEHPILQASSSLYYRKGRKNVYASVADMPAGTRIGLIIGYEYGDILEQHLNRFKVTRVNKQEQLLHMLSSDRIDVTILFDQVADYTLKQMAASKKYHFSRSDIVKGERHHTSDIYVVFSKKRKDARELAQMFDRGLAIIEADGRYKAALETPPH